MNRLKPTPSYTSARKRLEEIIPASGRHPRPLFTQSWVKGGLLCSLALGSVQTAHTKPEFLEYVRRHLKIARGGAIDRAGCMLCHAESGPPDWNRFGQDIHAALEVRHMHTLTAALLGPVMKMDSDGDGYTNEEELAADTLPGDPKSHPNKHLPVTEPEPITSPAGGNAVQPPNPFSPASILLAKEAQHPAIVHFPIALFIASVALELLGKWKRNPGVVAAAGINLTLAAISTVFTVVSGILAWRLKFEGAPLAGNLLYHFIGGLTTTAVIWTLLLMRRRGEPGWPYYALAVLGLLAVSITGHLGGVLSGVAN